MVPTSFANFFLATAGAGGALIGLLFVAVSIDRDRTFGRRAHPLRQGVASGAFAALVNAFFVSTWALLPHANIGYVALIVGAASALDTVRFCVDLLSMELIGRLLTHAHVTTGWRSLARAARTVGIVGPSLALYGFECVMAVLLMQHPNTVDYVYALGGVVLGVYAQGLARAWELLGAPRGLIMRLNPLNERWNAEAERETHAMDEETPPPGANADSAHQEAGVTLTRRVESRERTDPDGG